MDSVEVVPGLDPELTARVVAKLRELEPSTAAVLIAGSFLLGTADKDSDLDLVAVTHEEPSVPYRTWFEQREGEKPLHVSAGIRSISRWLERAQGEPQDWAFGFPSLYEASYVWSTDEARAKLGDPPSIVNPPAEPELEDFVEHLVKVRRAALLDDGVAVRLFAHDAALLAPGLLLSLNEEIFVRTRREAVDAALSLRVGPEHYRDDLLVCLGLVPADDDAVSDAALRLGRELLAFLRERNPDADPAPELPRYLADGTLERRLGFVE